MLFLFLLRRVVTRGRLTLVDSAGRSHSVEPGGKLNVTIRLHGPRVSGRLCVNPWLRVGEAYMDGSLTIEQGTLSEFLYLCTSGADAFDRHPIQTIGKWVRWPLRYVHQFNPVGRARANIAYHYGLSDSLYRLFLDADRQYSCAYFPHGNETLEEAQEKKKRHIAAKLLLEPGMHVLDIGSGWGGLALYLAGLASVEVTGITLSQEQLRAARSRAVEAGIEKRVRFELREYRDLTGRFDRIVSVGMFEHVGIARYRTFFDKLRHVLAPEGVALLHSIGRMEGPGTNNPWLRKYIFPGAYCPALSEVVAAVERSGLWITDVEVLRLHYAQTLKEWLRRFQANRDRVKELYDERFCRMWEFYLAGCEVAFRDNRMLVFQIQLAHRPNAVPLSRDYIADWEREQRPTSIRTA